MSINDMEKARRFVKDNLTELCQEILEWHNTAILRDGKVRELAQMLKFTGCDLAVAESMINSAALTFVANS